MFFLIPTHTDEGRADMQRVQNLAQGHFHMEIWGAGDQTTNPTVCGRPLYHYTASWHKYFMVLYKVLQEPIKGSARYILSKKRKLYYYV